ncbi:MAG: hypothetical protein AAFV59_18125, partial [Pseudomonadota bacterium]
LDCHRDGVLCALQAYETRWHLLPLCADARTIAASAGQMTLPTHSNATKIDYLSEPTDVGPHVFVLMLAEQLSVFEALSGTEIGTEISRSNLDQLAISLDEHNAHSWLLSFEVAKTLQPLSR